MKIHHIVAFAALACGSTSPFAAILTPSSGDGELFLTVWTDTAGTNDHSYTLDLGITYSDFFVNPNQVINASISRATDAYWAAFESGISKSDFYWSILAVDDIGHTNDNPRGLLTTVQAGADYSSTRQGDVALALARIGGWVDSVNASGSHVSQPNGSAFANEGNDDYYALVGGLSVPSGNWGSVPAFANGNRLNTSSSFVSFTKSGQLNATSANPTEQPGLWSFGDDSSGVYTLSYSPVPEAPAIVLALAGLGAMRLRCRTGER